MNDVIPEEAMVVQQAVRHSTLVPNLQTVMAACASAIAVVSVPEGQILLVSPAMARMLGISEFDLIGSVWKSLPIWSPSPLERESAVSGEQIYQVSFVEGANAVRHDAMLSSTVIREEDVAFEVITLTDISERRDTERALIWQHEQLERQRFEANAVLDAADEAIALVAPDGRLVLANLAFIRMVRIPRDDLLGVPVAQLSDALRPLFVDIDLGSILSGGPDAHPLEEMLVFSPSPESRAYLISSRSLIGKDLFAYGQLFTLQDVTRQRESDRLKEEFAANISHELRTPLTSIAGFAELLLDDDRHLATETAHRYVAAIHRNAGELIAQVSQLLDFSRAQSGEIAVHSEALEIAREIDRVVAVMGPETHRKQQSLAIDISKDLPMIWADRALFYQIVMNLISNAVRYTPEGGAIRISADKSGDSLAIHIADNGIGLADHERSLIFSRYYRVQTRGARSTPGTGLGLPIAKLFAEHMGGTIQVASEQGIGSVFTVRLPLAPVSPMG